MTMSGKAYCRPPGLYQIVYFQTLTGQRASCFSVVWFSFPPDWPYVFFVEHSLLGAAGCFELE